MCKINNYFEPLYENLNILLAMLHTFVYKICFKMKAEKKKAKKKKNGTIPVKVKIKVWSVSFEINKNAHLQLRNTYISVQNTPTKQEKPQML